MKYLTLDELLFLHHEAISRFGGEHSVRDLGLVQSAVARPQMTFGGKELYPGLFEKGAALVESLVRNHAFVDGNKRVGAYALGLFLESNGYKLETKGLELSDFILQTARGELDLPGMTEWIRGHASAENK